LKVTRAAAARRLLEIGLQHQEASAARNAGAARAGASRRR
jgi:hypothetical protein